MPANGRRYWGEMMTVAKSDAAVVPSLEELVAAHVDLVYGAALRQVRDPHLADDVTQAVFLVLARKRDRLPAEAVIAPWLLKVTRYTALTALRAQRRRRHYEAVGGAAREIPQTEMKSESAEAAPRGAGELHWGVAG
jgi:RNA polymerase sigma factor (sigma-70 family)